MKELKEYLEKETPEADKEDDLRMFRHALFFASSKGNKENISYQTAQQFFETLT